MEKSESFRAQKYRKWNIKAQEGTDQAHKKLFGQEVVAPHFSNQDVVPQSNSTNPR
jgi:hypothetical protein